MLMKNVMVTKDTLPKIIEINQRLMQVEYKNTRVLVPKPGRPVLLVTGAKLFYDTHARRYFIGGYAADNSDIDLFLGVLAHHGHEDFRKHITNRSFIISLGDALKKFWDDPKVKAPPTGIFAKVLNKEMVCGSCVSVLLGFDEIICPVCATHNDFSRIPEEYWK